MSNNLSKTDKLTLSEWKKHKANKIRGLSRAEVFSRYKDYERSRRDENRGGKKEELKMHQDAQRITNIIYEDHEYEMKDRRNQHKHKDSKGRSYSEKQVATAMEKLIDPWQAKAFRVSTPGMTPRSGLYSRNTDRTFSAPNTVGNVFGWTGGRDVGRLIEDVGVFEIGEQFNVQNTTTTLVTGRVAIPATVTAPAPSTINTNRANAYAIEISYLSEISLATGEMAYGTIPIEQAQLDFTYEQLKLFQNVEVSSIGDMIVGKPIVFMTKQSELANQFTSSDIASENVNVPIIAITGTPPQCQIKVRICETGECMFSVDDPRYATMRDLSEQEHKDSKAVQYVGSLYNEMTSALIRPKAANYNWVEYAANMAYDFYQGRMDRVGQRLLEL